MVSGEPPSLTSTRPRAGGGLQETEQRTHTITSTRHLWSGWPALRSSASHHRGSHMVCSHRCSAEKAHQRLFFLRRLRKFGTSPRILRSFYTCTVESILTRLYHRWFGNSTAGNRRALQRGRANCPPHCWRWASSLQDIYTRRCTRKARRIIKDSSHPSHRLLSLLPSGRRFRSIRSRTSRLRDSFFPQAIRLMNSQNNSPTSHSHSHNMPCTAL